MDRCDTSGFVSGGAVRAPVALTSDVLYINFLETALDYSLLKLSIA